MKTVAYRLSSIACILICISLMLHCGAQSHGPLSLQLADSLTLRFPGKPLDPEPYAPSLFFLDDYLMVFPGDFSANVFLRTDTGYAYQSNLKFWTEEKGKLHMKSIYQFFIADGWLWGFGNSTLYKFSLPNPTTILEEIPLPARENVHFSIDLLQPVICIPESEHRYTLVLPLMPNVRVKTVEVTSKQQEKYIAASRFATFSLTVDDLHSDVKWISGIGKNLSEKSVFSNFHMYTYLLSSLAISDTCIFLTYPTSDILWRFDLDGKLQDSIMVTAKNMPQDFVKRPVGLKRAEINAAVDSSCFFGKLMPMNGNSLIARQYWLEKDAEGGRPAYLQVIDHEKKTVRETALDPRAQFRGMYQNRLVQVTDWDISKGFVKIQFFDILLDE
jgi:hypothetical protein